MRKLGCETHLRCGIHSKSHELQLHTRRRKLNETSSLGITLAYPNMNSQCCCSGLCVEHSWRLARGDLLFCRGLLPPALLTLLRSITAALWCGRALRQLLYAAFIVACQLSYQPAVCGPQHAFSEVAPRIKATALSSKIGFRPSRAPWRLPRRVKNYMLIKLKNIYIRQSRKG